LVPLFPGGSEDLIAATNGKLSWQDVARYMDLSLSIYGPHMLRFYDEGVRASGRTLALVLAHAKDVTRERNDLYSRGEREVLAALRRDCGVNPRDILCADLKGGALYKPVFALLRDDIRREIVLVVRGSLGMHDVGTDADAAGAPVDLLTGEEEPSFAPYGSSGATRQKPGVASMSNQPTGDSDHGGVIAVSAGPDPAFTEPQGEVATEFATEIAKEDAIAAQQGSELSSARPQSELSSGRFSWASRTPRGKSHEPKSPRTRPRASSTTIRGKSLLTGQLGDSIDEVLASVQGKVCRYYFHSGMYKAAEAVLDRVADVLLALTGEQRLQGFCPCADPELPRSYRLVVTGHSMGAGVASILAFLIHKRRLWPSNRVVGVCLGPAASGSLNFAQESRPYLYQFLFDYDIVPRASLHSMAVLASRLQVLADNPAEARAFDSAGESRRLHRPSDLYVGGNVFCIQPERKEDSERAEGTSRVLSHDRPVQDGRHPTHTESASRSVYPYRVSLLGVHDLGELIFNEVALYDHGFYTHPIHILQKYEQEIVRRNE